MDTMQDSAGEVEEIIHGGAWMRLIKLSMYTSSSLVRLSVVMVLGCFR